MTVKAYREKLKRLDAGMSNEDGLVFSDNVLDGTDIWDNDAVLGYVLKAAKGVELNATQATALLSELKWLFDTFSVDAAARHWHETPYPDDDPEWNVKGG